MKRFWKIAGYTVGAILSVLLILILVISLSSVPHYEEIGIPDLQLNASMEEIAHGKELVYMNCMDCHFNQESGLMSGQFFGETPLGTAYTSNITRDPIHGIGSYSEGELYRLLRTGVKKNDELALPFMPQLTLMSEKDLHSIIAFLKSEDPILAPSDEKQVSDLSFLGKALTLFAFSPLPYPETYQTIPSVEDQVAYGDYLVNAQLLCFGCHSATHEVNLTDPHKTLGYLEGGNEFGPGLVSSRILRDEEGIGSWTEADFVNTLKTGVTPDGRTLKTPMTAYPQLKESEMTAIWAYLGTVSAGDPSRSERGN